MIATEQLHTEELAGLLERAAKVFSHVAIIRATVRAQIRDRATALALGTDDLLHLCALAVMGVAGVAELAEGLGKPRTETGRLMRELASEHLVRSALEGSTLRWTLDDSGQKVCDAVARGGLLAQARDDASEAKLLRRHSQLREGFEILADELGVAGRLTGADSSSSSAKPGTGVLQDVADEIEEAALVERVYRSLRRQQATHLGLTSAGALDTSSFMLLDLLRCGPMSAQMLCERLGLNYPRLLAVVRGMERQGLVDRRRRRDDVGTVEIQPTPAGSALIGTVPPFDPDSRFLGCMARLERAGRLEGLVQNLQYHVTRIGRGHVYPPRYAEVVRGLAEAMARGELLGPEPSVSGPSFRAAMGEFVTGVAIVTAATGTGGRGLTVNSFTSVSLEPPIVLVCLKREIPTLAAIEEYGRFGVNVLPASMEALARRFGSHEGPGNPHSLVDVEYWQEGDIPRLAGSLAWFGCRVDQVVDAGDHAIVLGAAERVRTGRDAADPPRTGSEAGCAGGSGDVEQADETALFFWRGRFGAMP